MKRSLRSGASLVGVAFLVGSACQGGAGGGGEGTFRIEAGATSGSVLGRTVDAESGAPVSDVTVTIGQDTTQRASGDFALTVATGVPTLRVAAPGYLDHVEEVVVTGDPLNLGDVAMARASEPHRFSGQAETVTSRQLTAEFPAGALPPGTEATVTWLGEELVGASDGPVLFMDQSGAFGRVLGNLHVTSSAQPAKAVTFTVPVAPDVKGELLVYEHAPDGDMRNPVPVTVSNGLATFSLSTFSHHPLVTVGTTPLARLDNCWGAHVRDATGKEYNWDHVSRVGEGATVTTGPGEGCRVMFPDGSKVELGPNTSIKIGALKDETKISCDQTCGRSVEHCEVRVLGQSVIKWRRFTIISPCVAVCAVRGTACEIETRPCEGASGTHVDVETVEGECSCKKDSGEEFFVHAGEHGFGCIAVESSPVASGGIGASGMGGLGATGGAGAIGGSGGTPGDEPSVSITTATCLPSGSGSEVMASGTASGPESARFEFTHTATSPAQVTCEGWTGCFRMPGESAAMTWSARATQLWAGAATISLEATVSGSDLTPLAMDSADVNCK